jgi:hypothetical protein
MVNTKKKVTLGEKTNGKLLIYLKVKSRGVQKYSG